MEGFNYKLGNWLLDLKIIFDEKGIQEEIFDLQVNAQDIGDTDREIELIKILSSTLLKLSFILKNDLSKTNSLIEYLKQK